jgi:hypothetical protein
VPFVPHPWCFPDVVITALPTSTLFFYRGVSAVFFVSCAFSHGYLRVFFLLVLLRKKNALPSMLHTTHFAQRLVPHIWPSNGKQMTGLWYLPEITHKVFWGIQQAKLRLSSLAVGF